MNANAQKNGLSYFTKAIISMVVCSAVTLLSAIIKLLIFCGKSYYIEYLFFSIAFVIISFAHFLHLSKTRIKLLRSPKNFALVHTINATCYIACIYLEIVSIYAMPILLASLLIAQLSTGKDSFSANLFISTKMAMTLFVQYLINGNSLAPIAVMFLSSLIFGSIAAYWVSSGAKRLIYLTKALLVTIGCVLLIIGLSLAFGDSAKMFIERRLLVILVISTVAQSFVAISLQPVLESIFNLVTNSRLVELIDHNSPLIKKLIEEAPGTFTHSLAVANFAEMCASAIGENPYLARACAYYHDIGKLSNPMYFKENQADSNPHDELLPEVSADIIRSHTTEGKRMCEEYRIPNEILDVTIQHHGTLPILMFYNKAKQLTDGEVDLNEYCYRGIKPETKIAAIIMICDSGEAAIRAMDNPDGEKVDKLLKSLIDERIRLGQFDNCNITLSELTKIRETIINGYGGQYHKRLTYPDGK